VSVAEDTARATAPASRFGTFALVFGVSFAIFYTVCDMAGWPMFTYHPGTDRIDPGFARARRDEGPAMYWYGWIASSALGASILGVLAALLPAWIARRIPPALAWVVPIALLPVLVYSLKFYWRW
jgi:ABC-type antimicrobial peptide transport system permease subunit